jgi:hypothetical protein
MTDALRQPAQVLFYGTPENARRRPWLVSSLVAVVVLLLALAVVSVVSVVTRAAERRAVEKRVKADLEVARAVRAAATQKVVP